MMHGRTYWGFDEAESLERFWRELCGPPSSVLRTTPLTVYRVEDTHEFSPTRLDGLGPRRCTVGLREGTKGAVRTVSVPCDTISNYRIGDTYEERIEKT
jgi:hypothetical protein